MTLQCSVLGGPVNAYQWLAGGVVIAGETSEDYTFNIMSASDGGEYTCVVTNLAGNDSASTNVFVAPYFTAVPADIETSDGDMGTLTCVAEAFPSPDYIWGRVDGGTIRDQVTGRNTSMLMFNPVMFGDEGDYYCNATSNGVTSQSPSATVTRKFIFHCN